MINIDDNSFYLKTKNGTLRLTIMDCGIVRTSFSADGVFDARQGKGMCNVQVEKDHETIQGQNETIIDTKHILVRINEETGAVTYVDKKGKTLLSERNSCPRQLEKISLYKVADN